MGIMDIFHDSRSLTLLENMDGSNRHFLRVQ
jgi:hypothetical protein